MNPAELLNELRGIGVRLSRNGDRLRIDAPKGVITDELRRQLVEHRADIVSMLVDSEGAKAARLIGERGYALVRSEFLDGEVVVFIRDESVLFPERWQNAVTYTLAELAHIRSVGQEALRDIHNVKSLFGGRIVTPTVADTVRK